MGEVDAGAVHAALEEETVLLEQVGGSDLAGGTFERIVIPMLDGDLDGMEARDAVADGKDGLDAPVPRQLARDMGGGAVPAR